MLNSKINPFGGCVVEADTLPESPEDFGLRLATSIAGWRQQGIKVAWLTLPISRAALIPVAVGAGFLFHHTDEGALTLTLRLVEGAYVPPGATHFIGAGGVVLTAERELLVVSERHRRAGTGRHYKLPGGALHPREHIAAAVAREILEETGIETRFRSLVCFRHWHGYRDGKSDIYFVCRLEPLTTGITCQREELDECRWMPVDEYLAHDEVSVFNKRVVRAALRGDLIVPEEIAGYGAPETHELFMPPEEGRHGDR